MRHERQPKTRPAGLKRSKAMDLLFTVCSVCSVKVDPILQPTSRKGLISWKKREQEQIHHPLGVTLLPTEYEQVAAQCLLCQESCLVLTESKQTNLLSEPPGLGAEQVCVWVHVWLKYKLTFRIGNKSKFSCRFKRTDKSIYNYGMSKQEGRKQAQGSNDNSGDV